ncbi:MAG: hypothetical protein R2715_11805 [Ilumatobacteraceae bacterium]
MQSYLTAARLGVGDLAIDDDGIGVYGRENARQIAALLDEPDPFPDAPTEPARRATSRRTDERTSLRRSFWECSDLGDRHLSDLLRASDPHTAADLSRRMVEAYSSAFAARSTHSERNSVLDHLRSLFELVRDPTIRDQLERSCSDLASWELAPTSNSSAGG